MIFNFSYGIKGKGPMGYNEPIIVYQGICQVCLYMLSRKYHALILKSSAMNITRDSSIGGDAACFSEVQYDSDQPKTGTVKYFFEDCGGCIEQDDGGDDLFTYLYEVVDNQVLNVGDAVRYVVGYDPQGEICAMNITRCAEEDEGLDGGDKVASGCAGASVGERQGSGTERVKKVA